MVHQLTSLLARKRSFYALMEEFGLAPSSTLRWNRAQCEPPPICSDYDRFFNRKRQANAIPN